MNKDPWTLLISILHFLVAISVTAHVAVHKRNVRSAIGWIGLVWFAPFIGAALYTLFGINRISRTGGALGLSAAWDEGEHAAESSFLIRGASIGHSGFVGMDRLAGNITGKPLSSGNLVEPLPDGDSAYPQMIAAIRGAERSITLTSYIFDDDEAGRTFAEALVSARQRGVEVRVLIDAIGSRYSRHSMVDILRRSGIKAALFLPTLVPRLFRYANLRNHRKILVVDGSIGFTGGMNIRAGHWLKLSPGYPIRCLHFRVEGPIVADLQRAFAIDWAFTSGERIGGELWFSPPENRGSVLARGISDGPDTDMDNMSKMMLGALAAAQFCVRIVTPYFLPDEAILAALKATALRGVDVDIVLPSKSNIFIMDWAMRPQLSDLVACGCRVHLTSPPFDHAKIFVVDRLWSFIGSTNWDARSLRLNFEYNLECYDEELAEKLEKLTLARISAAKQLTFADFEADIFPRRMRDGIARLLAPYL